MRDQAFASALSKKFEQNEVVLLDKIDIAQPKTKSYYGNVRKVWFGQTYNYCYC